MRTKFKQWAVDYLKDHHDIATDKIDTNLDFYKKPLYAEIGSGKGDFILNFSQLHPEYSFLAVERVETVAGMMAKKLKEAEIDNVLIFPFDGKVLFSELKDESLDGIF